MKRWMSVALTLVVALAMAVLLAGCASNNKSETEEQKAPETGDYKGTLVMAYEDQMSIAGDDGDMQFATTAETKYDLGDWDEMYLDDIVTVKYHVDADKKVADEVDLVEHMEKALEFAGTLVNFDSESLTLASKGSTVTFLKDDDTYLVGDLSQGDKIELTYLGNLSEYPYANVIAVVDEANQPETLTVRGEASEVAGGTLLLGIDSAHAYRFVLTSDTKTTGEANDVRAGDTVDVTYKGNIKEAPKALEINIVKQGKDRAYTINGKIAEVKQDSLVLETDKSKYTFGTSKYTKYNGEKPEKGYKAEITYTGALGDNPQAGIVYCVKSEKAASKATAKKEKKKASKASSKSNDSKQQPAADESKATPEEPQKEETPAEQPDDQKESEQPTPPSEEEETPEEPEEPQAKDSESAPQDDLSVSGQGTIVKGDEENKTVEIEMKDGTKITLTYNADTNIASGYVPAKGDVVKVVYGSSSKTLKKIQLVHRAEDLIAANTDDGDTKGSEDTEGATDDSATNEE